MGRSELQRRNRKWIGEIPEDWEVVKLKNIARIQTGNTPSKNADKKLSDQKTHTIHYGFIYDGDDFIDEVIVLIMKGPHSYTAEDTVEIDCHGGIMVVNKILETVIKYGARIAEPGEFTKRAFLNGRIDLTKAEAVMDLIESQNDYALKSA